MRVGLVILPSDRWAEARRQWEWADRRRIPHGVDLRPHPLGRHARRPWHAAVPVLAAAAAVTERVRLGTLVATPNFRHPVTLARDALALDDVSNGRLDLGLGPGSEGPDATALGQEPWTPAERLARFEEFLQVLQPDRGRRADDADVAADARTTPPTRRPARREPCSGPSPSPSRPEGPRVCGSPPSYGRNWVTVGPTGRGRGTPEDVFEAITRQLPLLDDACRAVGREPSSIGRILLWTPTEPVITSRRPIRRAGRPLRRARLRPVRAASPGPDGALLRATSRRSSRSPSAPRWRT